MVAGRGTAVVDVTTVVVDGGGADEVVLLLSIATVVPGKVSFVEGEEQEGSTASTTARPAATPGAVFGRPASAMGRDPTAWSC